MICMIRRWGRLSLFDIEGQTDERYGESISRIYENGDVHLLVRVLHKNELDLHVWSVFLTRKKGTTDTAAPSSQP
jgi:hypothetical protein